MTDVIDTLVGHIQEAGNQVLAVFPDDRRSHEMWGWHFAPLSRKELAGYLFDANTIIANNRQYIDVKLHELEIVNLIITVELLKQQIIPHMHGTPNPGQYAFMSTVEYINHKVAMICRWQMPRSTKMLPPNLIRKLQDMQSDLEGMAPDRDDLRRQVNLIQSATLAADELPETLHRLKMARDRSDSYLKAAAENNGRIDDTTKKSEEILDLMTTRSEEADRLIAQCEEAYRTTTSRGLAAAFHERAENLNWSIRFWVAGLTAALIAGAVIGYIRVEQLTAALNAPAADWGIIWAKVVLSALSVAAPLWLAWLATKQIGQRFRLAEDYGFKASVARAYEGYRKEAAKFEPAVVERLFSSALSRLEEAPLRLVETESPGSPWHEFARTPEFKKAAEIVPGFAEKVSGLLKIPKKANVDAPAPSQAPAE